MRQVGPTDIFDSHLLNMLVGRIALGKHDWRGAERYFSAALVDAEQVLHPELTAQLYAWRGEANAALGRPAQAYADAREHATRLRAVTDASSARRIALLRVRFATDREIANNDRLRQDRARLLGQAKSEKALRNAIVVVAVLAVLSFALIMLALQRRRNAETAQRESAHRIEELGRLTAGIAHEFNNLLTIVQQSVGLLRHRLAGTADAQSLALLDTAGEAALTGGAVTQQLLAFGLQQTLQPNAIAVQDFIATVLPQLQIAAGTRLTLRSELDPAATTLTADPRQLTSALLNLILNARDAMNGSGAVIISSQLVAGIPGGPRMIALTVADDGSGMSAAVLERATEPFFTTKQVGSGNGLGLSAVAGFARQSGGTLHIRSDPGRGTAVTLTLPAASPTSRH